MTASDTASSAHDLLHLMFQIGGLLALVVIVAYGAWTYRNWRTARARRREARRKKRRK